MKPARTIAMIGVGLTLAAAGLMGMGLKDSARVASMAGKAVETCGEGNVRSVTVEGYRCR